MSDGKNQNDDIKKTKFPSWIQPQIFEELLQNLCDNFMKIEKFSVDHALTPGENYATIVLKVEIIMKLKDSLLKPISFMLKIGHDTQICRDLMNNHNVFDIETGMYRTFIPEFEQLYLDAGVKVKFGAKYYQLPIDQQHILLENLKVHGFKNVNRLEGLDMEHTKCVLKKLAQWHAASAVRVTKKGIYPRDFCTAYLKPEGYELIKNMFDAGTKVLLECVKEYSNSELYFNKVLNLQSLITDELFKVIEADPNEFNVLNHGDCWSNNIMFQYDDRENIVETYLIDYQMPRYTTPAQDLYHFILSSTQFDIKLKQFDYFIKYYHDNLIENLKLLKYCKSLPTLKEIHIMLYKYGIFGYMTSTNIMAAALCDPTDNASLDNFINESAEAIEFKKQVYANARYRKQMEAIYPWLLNRGLLDCL